MLLVGLTGGIGSGKSTVARMLAERGAVVVDADVVAREAIDPGTPGHELVVREFGPDVVGPDGSVDRNALAALVFDADEARRKLEAIVHPEVFRVVAEKAQQLRDTDSVLVFDAPLIVETGFHEACDALVVVSAPLEAQVERLLAARGMTEEDAVARIEAQAPLEHKVRVADEVIVNDGSLEDLRAQVDALWVRLAARAKERTGT